MTGVYAFKLIISNFLNENGKTSFCYFIKLHITPPIASGIFSTADVARPVIKLRELFHSEG